MFWITLRQNSNQNISHDDQIYLLKIQIPGLGVQAGHRAEGQMPLVQAEWVPGPVPERVPTLDLAIIGSDPSNMSSRVGLVEFTVKSGWWVAGIDPKYVKLNIVCLDIMRIRHWVQIGTLPFKMGGGARRSGSTKWVPCFYT